MSITRTRRDNLIGQRVCKHWYGDAYYGTIVSTKTPPEYDKYYWHVLYDDQDEEDYTMEDLKPILVTEAAVAVINNVIAQKSTNAYKGGQLQKRKRNTKKIKDYRSLSGKRSRSIRSDPSFSTWNEKTYASNDNENGEEEIRVYPNSRRNNGDAHNGSQGMQNQGSEDKELGDMFAKTMAELVNVIHTLNKRDLRRQDLYEMELAIICEEDETEKRKLKKALKERLLGGLKIV